MAGLPLPILIRVAPGTGIRTDYPISVSLIHPTCQGISTRHVQPQESEAPFPQKSLHHFKHKTAQSLVAISRFKAK